MIQTPTKKLLFIYVHIALKTIPTIYNCVGPEKNWMPPNLLHWIHTTEQTQTAIFQCVRILP